VRKLNNDLERRVAQRTAELEDANRELKNEIKVRKRAEEALRHNQSHVEQLNRRLQRAMTETHHRVKNNLQIIAAMVDMRMMDDQPMIPTEEIKRLGAQVRTLAAVHDILTHEAKGDGQAHDVSAQAVLDKLLPMLQEAACGRPIHALINDVRLTARQGTSLALVVNELVSNAIKYGQGDVTVSFDVDSANAVLTVCDDGPGFPPGFAPERSANTGLELVQNLSRWDLQASAEFRNRPEGGAEVVVTIPLHRSARALAASAA
jgi:two-component sensor histidine kinase